jgi:outer membrane protein assembly factor BamB
MPSYLHVVSSDGAFHSMYISNGEEPKAAVKFLPANANAVGLTMIDTTAYAATINNCGGAANGVWALDTTNGSVASWKGNVAGNEGFAFGPDGSVIAATAEGQVAVLEAKTLAAKGSYSAGGALTSTPVLFENKGKAMIAVGAKDGSIHVIDSASLGAAAAKSAASGGAVESLATFADGRGGRYLLAARGKTVTAHKVVEQGGSLAIQDAWTSKEIPNVLTPLVFSGVAFALAGGDAKTPAKLYALEAATGKELWNSGTTITSFVPTTGGMTAGGSAVYLGTHDGTVWAFGIPIEH